MTHTFTVLTCDVPNKNNRVYPRATIEKAIEASRERMESRTMLGHIGFRKTPLTDVSHLVTKLWLANEQFMAEVEFLPTKTGIWAEENIHLLALRPSGTGTVKMIDGHTVIMLAVPEGDLKPYAHVTSNTIYIRRGANNVIPHPDHDLPQLLRGREEPIFRLFGGK